MATNYNLGLPQILITFKSEAATAMIRSSRGTGALILHQEDLRDTTFFTVEDAADIPAEISASNTDLIKKALLGTPEKLHVFAIPPESWTETQTISTTTTIVQEIDEIDDEITTVTETVTVPTTVTVTSTVISPVTMNTALNELSAMKWNWICCPTGSSENQSDLATWVKNQRNNKHRSYKAVVANVAAGSEGVVNFTTGNIKVINPAYSDALTENGGDELTVDPSIPKYVTYTAAQYTARIMGILTGIGLDRSATYYELDEVESCSRYADIGGNIDNGELCIFDEGDGNGVKIARGCNSLTTFTASKGQDFRFIKVVEALDLIRDDITDSFKNDYVGKVVNTYENKALLISAINLYLKDLEAEGVLSNTAENYVEIDLAAHRNWASTHNIDIENFSDQQLREINTSSYVFLTGVIHPVNALEDLTLTFTLQ